MRSELSHWNEISAQMLSGRLPLRMSERRLLLLVVDALAVNVSVLIALWLFSIRQSKTFSLEYVLSGLQWFFFLTVVLLLVGYLNDFYDLETAADRQRILVSLVRAAVVVFLIYPVIYFFLPPKSQARTPVFFSEVIAFLLLGGWRFLYASVLTVPRFQRPVVIVGAGWAGHTIALAIQDSLRHEYQPLGYIDDDPAKAGTVIAGLPVLGNSGKLTEMVEANRVSEIIVAITHAIRGELIQALVECNSRGVQITPMTRLYEQITGRLAVEHVGANWFLDLPIGGESSLSPQRFVKRLLDVTLALIALVVSIPWYPLIAWAIYVDNAGPIFYFQERVGQGGRPFRIIKFRSMIAEAEEGGEVQWATQDDIRITRVGRFLRRARLDELPQFINVLRGEMSVIGPRPERPEFIDKLEEQIPFYRMRLQAKPGLTGWAQVEHGYASSVEDSLIKLQYDLYYVKHWSVYLDLLILWRTVWTVLRFGGR
jgi:exopolysaccharide biosynthesis polyprenyl glycosylphosphotransferase